MPHEANPLREHFHEGAALVVFHFVEPADEMGIVRLTSGERHAARRLHFAADRAAYVASHMLMRSGFAMLGHPFACPLARTPLGHPFVEGVPFHFSLSRTRRLVACAFAVAGPLGLDVEDRDRLGDLDDLVPAMMTPAEQSRLAAMPDDRKAAEVLKTWTRKEAILKAMGTGLSIAPDTFSVDADTSAVGGLARRWRFAERWLSPAVHCTLATCVGHLPVRFQEVDRFAGPDAL